MRQKVLGISGGSWLLWLVLALASYVLRCGPAWWLHKKGHLAQ
jgi:hypothetical protein